LRTSGRISSIRMRAQRSPRASYSEAAIEARLAVG
jgi:hypothetical protein